MKRLFSFKKGDVFDIKVRHDKDISPDKVQILFMSVGWNYRDIQNLKKSMENSLLITSAWDGDKLVGIARATGDGVFNATIWDVAVKPQYQKQGIGKLIVNSMLTKLDDCGIPLITLYTTCTKKSFYSKLGFEHNFSKVMGMYRYSENNFK